MKVSIHDSVCLFVCIQSSHPTVLRRLSWGHVLLNGSVFKENQKWITWQYA